MATLDVSQLLWKTRGLHWDYEFIAVPERPRLPAWMNTLDELLASADAEAEELRFGELIATGPNGIENAHPFAAVRFLDPERKDWTGRRVQHFAVWFVPRAILSVPDELPIGWHHQALAAMRETYGSEGVFGISEQAMRDWPPKPHESRAAYVLRVVRQTAPTEVTGVSDAGLWKRVPPVKKKIAGPSAPQRRPTANPRVGLLLIGALVLLLLGLLARKACG